MNQSAAPGRTHLEYENSNHSNLSSSDSFRALTLQGNSAVNERIINDNVRVGDEVEIEYGNSRSVLKLKVISILDNKIYGQVVKDGQTTTKTKSVAILDIHSISVNNHSTAEAPFDQDYVTVELPVKDSRYTFLLERLERDDMVIVNSQGGNNRMGPSQTIGKFCYVKEPNPDAFRHDRWNYGAMYVAGDNYTRSIQLNEIISLKISPDTMKKIQARNPMLHEELLQQQQEPSSPEPQGQPVELCKDHAAQIAGTLADPPHE